MESGGPQQHAFYRGSDGAINHIFWDGPSSKLYFDQWTARTGAPIAAGDPAVMLSHDPRFVYQQHVFYRGMDGAINHIFWDPTTAKLYFDQWTARTGAPPAAGNPATMVTPDQQQHIFYRDGAGAIQHIFWDGPSGKLYHDQWTARAGAPPAAGDPATMVAHNQQHIFYQGTRGELNHVFWNNGFAHDEWTAPVHAPGIEGNPATMVVY
jgi:hypothetical protein